MQYQISYLGIEDDSLQLIGDWEVEVEDGQREEWSDDADEQEQKLTTQSTVALAKTEVKGDSVVGLAISTKCT